MKKVRKLSAIPAESAVLDGFGKIDFFDAYEVAAGVGVAEKTAVELAREIVVLPAWAAWLFKIRNAIVGIFGLKTDSENKLFPIVSQTENEVVMGLSDKHLDFRVSIIKLSDEGGAIALITVVQFNNIWGRLYFLPVKPFHKMIIKSLLRHWANK